MAAEDGNSIGEIAGIDGIGSGSFDALGRPISSDGIKSAGNAGENNEPAGIEPKPESNSESERIGGARIFDPAGDSDSGNGDSSGQWGFKSDGTPRRKPGRRPGTGTVGGTSQRKAGTAKPAAKSSKDAISGIEKILFSVHAMVAIKTNCPELALDQKESNMLATALNAVQEHYGVEIPPEYAIWVNLVSACGMIYGPRIVQISARKKRERKEKEPPKTPYAPQSEPQKTAEPPMPMTMTLPGMHAPII